MFYEKIRKYIDKVDGTNGTDNYFHEVRLYPNHRQTVDAICMIDGAIGQLVTSAAYGLKEIPLSEDYAIPLFFHKGTEAVMPDLIKYISTVTANDTVDVNVTNNPLITKEAEEETGEGGEGGNNGEGGTT